MSEDLPDVRTETLNGEYLDWYLNEDGTVTLSYSWNNVTFNFEIELDVLKVNVDALLAKDES